MPGNRVLLCRQGTGHADAGPANHAPVHQHNIIANVVENIVYRCCPFADKTDLSNIYTNSITVNGWA